MAIDSQELVAALDELKACEESGNLLRSAEALVELGITYLRHPSVDLSNARNAKRCLVEALNIFVQSEDDEGIRSAAARLSEIGALYHSYGEFNTSLECYQLSLDAVRRLHDRRTAGLALIWIGVNHSCVSDYGKAIKAFNQALLLLDDQEDSLSQGRLLAHLADAHYRSGNGPAALGCYAKALPLLETCSDYLQLKDSLKCMARIFTDNGDDESAMKCRNEAKEMRI